MQTVDAVCQALERLRDDVPRHIWAKTTGLGFIANGATSIKQLLASTHQKVRANISLLQRAGISDFDDFNFDWQKAHLETWAKRAIIVNAGMKRYRDAIIAKLIEEGYSKSDLEAELQAADDEELKETKKAIEQNKAEGYKEYCAKVPKAEDLSELELEKLKEQRAKTEAERLAERKGNLKQRYGVEVTPELVEKDDSGWYAKLRLYYYLTLGNQFLAARDKRKIDNLSEDTGKAFIPDINRQCLSARVYALKTLNIEQFFDVNSVFSKHSLKEWFDLLDNPLVRSQIRTLLGIMIGEKDTPIAVANRVLKLLGLKMECIGSAGGRENKHRIYGGCNLNQDERDRVLAVWYQRDCELSEREEAA